MERVLTRIMAVIVILTLFTLTLGIVMLFYLPRTTYPSAPVEGDPDIRASVIEFGRANEAMLTPGIQPFGIIDEIFQGEGYVRFETTYCTGLLDSAHCYSLILYNALPDLREYAPSGNGWLRTQGRDTFYLEPITEKLYYRCELSH